MIGGYIQPKLAENSDFNLSHSVQVILYQM